MKFKRILIKLSGESLSGKSGRGIDVNSCIKISKTIKKFVDCGLEVSLVIGAGNFWRGRSETDISRMESDKIGILATAMNSIAFSDILKQMGVDSVICSPLYIKGIFEDISINEAIESMRNRKVVIFPCGIGFPFFSTDTAASLRACEINADILFKATTVDGIYSSDPKIDLNAEKYDSISFDEILSKNLKVMDMTSILLCRDNKISLFIFKFENMEDAVFNQNCGTLVSF